MDVTRGWGREDEAGWDLVCWGLTVAGEGGASRRNRLWSGMTRTDCYKLSTSESSIPMTYRRALLLVRKLCGFKGHSVHRGCSKCFKYFPGGFNEKTDYSGFHRDTWPPLHNSSHRKHAKMVRKASTQAKHESLTTKYGVYYSCLLELEYFDAVKFTAIDPMHNLFLGTAKHVFKRRTLRLLKAEFIYLMLEQGLDGYPTELHQTMVATLHHSGRIGFIQCSIWRCWQTFVLACQYLTLPVLSKTDILKAQICSLSNLVNVLNSYIWKKVCDTKHAPSLPFKGLCYWLWTCSCILVF